MPQKSLPITLVAGIALSVFLLAGCGGGGGGGDSGNRATSQGTNAGDSTGQDQLAQVVVRPQSQQYVTYTVAPVGGGTSISVNPPLTTAGGAPVTKLEDIPDGIAASDWARTTGTRLPLRVVLQDGTYRLTRTWLWGPASSGRADSPVQIVAANPGGAIITGARTVTLSPGQQGAQSAVAVDLETVAPTPFEQLWVNDRRAIRARAPNAGSFFHIQGALASWNGQSTVNNAPAERSAFQADSSATAVLNGVSSTELQNAVLVATHSWTTSHQRIQQASTDHKLLLSPASQWPFWQRSQHQRYFIENLASALDAEREWFYNDATQTLSYRPTTTERNQSLSFHLPQLSTLLEVRGDLGNNRWAEHLSFEGLTFRHAGYNLPAAGLIDPQAAVAVPAAIMINSARHVALRQCEVSRVGGYAVWLRERVQHSAVQGCEIYDTGAGGIRVGLPNQSSNDTTPTGHNTIRGNRVHATGHQFPGAVGIWLGQTSNNTVDVNLIGDTTYTGISVGWTWGYANSTANNNIIQRNYLYDLMQGSLSDGGGIYTLGRSPGTVIQGNVIRGVRAYNRYGSGGWGIYNDEGSSNLQVDSNIVVNTDHGGYMLHYGTENSVTNNAFYGGRAAEIEVARVESALQATLENNRFFPASASFVSYKADTGMPALSFRGNKVSNQLVALNSMPAACGNGCVLAESMTMSVGELFEVPKIFEAGSQVPLAAAVAPDWRATGVTDTESASLWWGKDDGYEFNAATSALGSRPVGFQMVPADRPDLIAVTQNQGERCLAIKDEAALGNRWEPFGYVYTDYTTGTTSVTFTFKADATTELMHEWRDTGVSPQLTGPAVILSGARGIVVRGQVVAPLPLGEWVTIHITANQGMSSRWNMRVSYANGSTVQLTDQAPASANWQRTRAVYFVSNANTDSTSCIGRWSINNAP